MRDALVATFIALAAILLVALPAALPAALGNVTVNVPGPVAPPAPPGPGGGGVLPGGLNITPPVLPPGAAFIVTAPAPVPDRGSIAGYNLTSGYWCADLSQSSQLPPFLICFYTTGYWPYWEIIVENVTRPPEIPPIESQLTDQLAYQYMNITVKGSPPASLFENITIQYKVQKTWLESNFVSPTSIRLSRYSAGWADLPTSLLGQDDKHVTFDSHYSPGFSYFAIHGTPQPPLVPLPAFIVERLDLFVLLLVLLLILLLYLLAWIRRTRLDIRRMERIKALQRVKRQRYRGLAGGRFGMSRKVANLLRAIGCRLQLKRAAAAEGGGAS